MPLAAIYNDTRTLVDSIFLGGTQEVATNSNTMYSGDTDSTETANLVIVIEDDAF